MTALPDPGSIVGLGPRAQVLLLGVFHFAANRDHLKQEHPWEVFSERRQAEIEEVVGRLAAFRPTKVCLEHPAAREEELDRLYRAYREGARELEPAEDEQLGFRLAARLGHDRVYGIDAWGLFEEEDDRWPRVEERARAAGRRGFFDIPGTRRYEALFRHDDLLKTQVSLREFWSTSTRPSTWPCPAGYTWTPAARPSASTTPSWTTSAAGGTTATCASSTTSST